MAVVEVVKYNGGSDVFAWKYPSEELGTWTQLVVNESQEAVLLKGGTVTDVFSCGRHTLSTANIPILNNLINLPFGGLSPFTAEVWYINKAFVLDVKWGTATPIQLQDPKYGVFVPVRSFGQFGIKIEDSKKFLIKLVGTLPQFDKAAIIRYFRGLYLTKVKDAISSYLIKQKIGVMEINAYLEELSEYMQEKMTPVLAEYGIRLVNFYTNDISVPEDDQAVVQLKKALAKKAEMDIIGYSYKQERSFDTLEGAANNSGSSSDMMGVGMGLGMGAAVGGAVGGKFGSVAGELEIDETAVCPNCNSKIPAGKRYCPDCGCDTEKKSEHKHCPHCGELIQNTAARYCSACGGTLQKVCQHCGAVVQGDSNFCAECGGKLKPTEQTGGAE